MALYCTHIPIPDVVEQEYPFSLLRLASCDGGHHVRDGTIYC